MVLPAGTPKPIADKLQAALAKVAADPEVIERFKVQGVEIRSSTPEEFKTFYLKEEKVWTTLMKEQGIKSEARSRITCSASPARSCQGRCAHGLCASGVGSSS